MTWFVLGMFVGIIAGIFVVGLLAGGGKRVPRPSMWCGIEYPDVEEKRE